MLPLLIGLLAPTPIATAEAGLGAAVCGARGDVDCQRATTGVAFDLRGAWHPAPWIGLGAGVLYASLPADGTDAGTLWAVGPEITLLAHLTPTFRLLGAAMVGFDRIAGTGGSQTGWGALGLRLGARRQLTHGLDLGLDYGLLRPRLDELCEAGTCGQVEAALVHRFSLVVGVSFW